MIKNTFVLLSILISTQSISAFAASHQSLSKFTLAPGEKKTIEVKSEKPTKVGFDNDLSMELAKSCKHSCVKMTPDKDSGYEMASAFGGAQELKPVKGNIQVVFENVETFPIPVEVYKE